MGNGNGCTQLLVIVMAALMIGFSSYFSARDTPFNQNELPFVLANAAVDYSFTETFNCQFIISGNVEFLEANTIDRTNVVIKLQPLGTYDDRPAGTAYIDNDNSYGLILVGNYWYFVWVHDLTLNKPLSEEILVDNLDCADGRIRAIVNFRQILPF